MHRLLLNLRSSLLQNVIVLMGKNIFKQKLKDYDILENIEETRHLIIAPNFTM